MICYLFVNYGTYCDKDIRSLYELNKSVSSLISLSLTDPVNHLLLVSLSID